MKNNEYKQKLGEDYLKENLKEQEYREPDVQIQINRLNDIFTLGYIPVIYRYDTSEEASIKNKKSFKSLSRKNNISVNKQFRELYEKKLLISQTNF